MAGLFAAPAAALAQSSVTISGFLKMGFENLKLGDFSSARTGANTNKSQYGVVDDLSRIIFNVREDLGGGLAAIGQLDIRVKPDDTQGAGQPERQHRQRQQPRRPDKQVLGPHLHRPSGPALHVYRRRH